MDTVYNLLPKATAQNILYTSVTVISLITLLAMHGYKNTKRTTHNTYIIHEDEVLPDVSYYTHSGAQVKHLVVNMSWDSLWLLCYYYIVTEQPIQPIYFMQGGTSSEIVLLKSLRKLLTNNYQHKRARLLPTYYVTNICKSRDVSKFLQHLSARSNILPRIAPEYILFENTVLFSQEYPWPLQLGISRESNLANFLRSTREIELGGKWDTAVITHPDILKKIVLPISHLSTDKLKQQSLDSRNYFYNYLLMATNS